MSTYTTENYKDALTIPTMSTIRELIAKDKLIKNANSFEDRLAHGKLAEKALELIINTYCLLKCPSTEMTGENNLFFSKMCGIHHPENDDDTRIGDIVLIYRPKNGPYPTVLEYIDIKRSWSVHLPSIDYRGPNSDKFNRYGYIEDDIDSGFLPNSSYILCNKDLSNIKVVTGKDLIGEEPFSYENGNKAFLEASFINKLEELFKHIDDTIDRFIKYQIARGNSVPQIVDSPNIAKDLLNEISDLLKEPVVPVNQPTITPALAQPANPAVVTTPMVKEYGVYLSHRVGSAPTLRETDLHKMEIDANNGHEVNITVAKLNNDETYTYGHLTFNELKNHLYRTKGKTWQDLLVISDSSKGEPYLYSFCYEKIVHYD